MRECEVVVIGGGPAGLSAAIEVAKTGSEVIVVDENETAGGQLYKQIHKFMGAKEQQAGNRGFYIAKKLLDDAKEHNVKILLNSPVYGIFPGNILVYGDTKGSAKHLKARKIIIATGANENSIYFEGSDLPGVMTAGAIQTMMNMYKVLPGKKVVIIGSGNIGLVIADQLVQAGAEVVSIVESSKSIGGYGVYASKLRRLGIPIMLSHTIKRCLGRDEVERVEIIGLDEYKEMVRGSEKILEVDTVCLAVGLSPMTELAYLANCKELYMPVLGGSVPIHNEDMQTTIEDIYVAGDITGIEEACTAIEEGRLAGVACAQSLGYYGDQKAELLKDEIRNRINILRSGEFGEKRYNAKAKLMEAFGEVAYE